MAWKLFLDDERYPVTDDWIIARSSEDARTLVRGKGMPVEIAFDHDLGGDDTSVKFIWWFIDQHYDNGLVIPLDFTYSVHSQNPVGAERIKSLVDGFLDEIR